MAVNDDLFPTNADVLFGPLEQTVRNGSPLRGFGGPLCQLRHTVTCWRKTFAIDDHESLALHGVDEVYEPDGHGVVAPIAVRGERSIEIGSARAGWAKGTSRLSPRLPYPLPMATISFRGV